jgi:S1-C subfamily serine protease
LVLLTPNGRAHVGGIFALGAALALAFPLSGCCTDCAELGQLGAVSYSGPAAKSATRSQGYQDASTGDRLRQDQGRASISSKIPSEPSEQVGTEAIGAAFYVNTRGDLLTTADQIRNCRKVAILDEYEFRDVTVVANNPLNGLTLLRTGNANAAHATFRITSATAGEPVSAFSYPIVEGLFTPLEVSKGTVESIGRRVEETNVLAVSALPTGRAVGGPIVDQRGDVIGITVPKLNTAWPGHVTYGISSALVLRFLNALRIETSMQDIAAAGAGAPEKYRAAYAGDYTVPVICLR